MDINSLLSPQESPTRSNPPPTSNAAQSGNLPPSPLRRGGRPGSGKRTTSTLSQEITLNSPPQDGPPRSAPHLGYDSIAQAQQTAFNPAYNNGYDVRTPQSSIATPGSDMRSPFGTPQLHRPSLQYASGRPLSNPQMETLADLASMQHPQVSRHSPYADVHRSPSVTAVGGRIPVHRSLSVVSSSDLVMAEAPSQTPPPRVVAVPSLSDADQKIVHELENYLANNSYAYDSHVQLINLLHQGFVAHIYDEAGEIVKNPGQYNLLSDLRQAREAMDSRFAVGEDIWKDWLHDESLLARTGEERMSVMELCQKAVIEEPSSVTLWLFYGEYVMHTFSVANGQEDGDPSQWTDEDKIICQAVFTREVVLDVWERAVRATEWRIDESSRVWDRYIDWIMAEFPETPTPGQVEQVNSMFMLRLQIPHSTWDATSSKFWPVVSKHNAGTWEEIMAATNEMALPGKEQYALRGEYELSVKRASESGDKTALYTVFNDYLNWEVKNKRKARKTDFNFEIRSALFERALLRFPTVIEWWLNYVDFLVTAKADSPAILPVLERATRHCPWSGDLWSRRLLRSEIEKRPYEEIGNVKHKATNSGLLDIGGMEEVLKVYSAWCNYLRRRAFDPENTDDEVDMAEMGITGTLEDAEVAGKKIYGEDFKGDPLFRLEKIHIKFLTQARRVTDARAVWERLTPAHSASADFWLKYYHFELLLWAHERLSEGVRLETPNNGPHYATSILRKALQQRDLDWPEKIIEAYSNHFQHHESAEAAQQADVETRNASHYLQIRRTKEAEEAAAAAAAAQPQQTRLETISEEVPALNKRKRDDEPQRNGVEMVKRTKTEDVKAPAADDSASASAQLKRDREHNTITAKDLPKDISEKRIRQFFGDCGDILSVDISVDDNAILANATVEFGDHEGAMAARTRDGKKIDGHAIRIQSGTLSTLYVTNYPADYDETKIRELFQAYGTVISVRFPSLKFNARRRFCYVQFFTSEEARAATAVNGKAIDGQNQLTAVISDPDAKKSRSGATSEGRELHVANVDFNSTEKDIREFFSQHGTVESIRLIRNAAGKFFGTCFVVYSKSEEATAAVELNNKPFKSRLVRVTLATDKSSAAKQATTKLIHNPTGIAEPEDAKSPSADTNGRRTSVASAGDASGELNEQTAMTKRERTVALLNLPDTVNDARIQSHLSTYGPLRKIVMKRDRGGALVEFVNLQDAGKVGMGIDCSSLGADVRVGTASELLPNASKTKQSAAAPASKPLGAMKPAQASVSRPKQVGGRRGGLGLKRGGLGSGAGASKTAVDTDSKMEDGPETTGQKKGNSDFRALFEKSREEAAAAVKGGDEEKEKKKQKEGDSA